MKGNNKMEILRMGTAHDLDILNPAEQDEILGGKTETHCQKGYSAFWGYCGCGYKEIVTEDNDQEDKEEEAPEEP